MPHDYFAKLAALPQTYAAIAFRSDAEIQSFPEAAKTSTTRQPIVYDPVQDAAVMRFWPPTSIDIKGRYLPLKVQPTDTSFSVVWDFRFGDGFRYRGEDYVRIHKTWRINPGPWLAFKTEYQEASRDGRFAELRVTLPGSRFLVPPDSWQMGEWLRPIVNRFYFEPDEWVRCWLHVSEWDAAVVKVSVWAASESQPVTQMLDRVSLKPPFDKDTFVRHPLGQFFVEYDTSADETPMPEQWIYSWNRNFVLMRDLPLADIPALLERPAPSDGPVATLPGIPGPIIVRRV